MTTIKDIYGAINPMPAMLSAKGKVNPTALIMINANSHLSLHLGWKKPYGQSWETEGQCFLGDTFEQASEKALEYIAKLPSADDAKLQHFMKGLAKIIDEGNAEGIAVDYMNPLVDTMKRLAENAITYQPDDDIPY